MKKIITSIIVLFIIFNGCMNPDEYSIVEIYDDDPVRLKYFSEEKKIKVAGRIEKFQEGPGTVVLVLVELRKEKFYKINCYFTFWDAKPLVEYKRNSLIVVEGNLKQDSTQTFYLDNCSFVRKIR